MKSRVTENGTGMHLILYLRACTCVLVYGKGALMRMGSVFNHRIFSCHGGYCRVVHGGKCFNESL